MLYCAENDRESVARLKRELRTRVRVGTAWWTECVPVDE